RLDVIGIGTARRAAALPSPASGGGLGRGQGPLPLLAPHLSDELFPEPAVALPAMPLSEHVVEDYVPAGRPLKEQPVRFFPYRLAPQGALRTAALRSDPLPPLPHKR